MNADFKNILIYSTGILALISLISFRALRLSERKVSKVQIEITNNQEFYLIDQFEIQKLLNKGYAVNLLETNFDQLDFNLLETQVEENPFVAEIDIFINVTGVLGAKVSQAEPIGRLINSHGSDQYIDKTGKLLPMNVDD